MEQESKKRVLSKDPDLVKKFTLFVGDLQELHKRYKEVSDDLIISFKRSSGDRKKQLEELLENITILIWTN